MRLGHNYSPIHSETLKEIKKRKKRLLRLIQFVSWTSDPTPWNGDPVKTYNCFGFALGIFHWLQPPLIEDDPDGDERYVWPIPIRPHPDNHHIGVFIEAAKSCRFVDCGMNSSWEPRYEKIALMADKEE